MDKKLDSRLHAFADEHAFSGRGALCVALVVTRCAGSDGLPIKKSQLLTPGGGQVAGLGRAPVQAILADHGIDRVLAEEGGRTSRGSIGKMNAYVEFLNSLNDAETEDLAAIERWWIDRVLSFFASRPFRLRLDSSKSPIVIVSELLEQARKRQRDSEGATYVGTVLQHLVGAKLDIVLGGIKHHGASTADQSTGRESDFLAGDVAIHVTSAPSEALLRKCEENLGSSLRVIIVTTPDRVALARGLVEQFDVLQRVDVLDIEQFLTSNLYEHGRFDPAGRRRAVENLIAKYNEIVTKHETDPGLRIELAN